MAALVLCLGLTGCSRTSSGAVVTAPTPVTVSHPLKRIVSDYADFTSRAAAVESVEVRARVVGYLDKIYFKEGTLVKKGDLLFEIDPRFYQAQVDFAKAQLAANEVLLKRAKADNVRYKAAVKLSPGAVTPQDLDQYQAAEDQATANVRHAKATLQTNALNLDFTNVISPIDGRISRHNLTVGNLVQQDVTLLTTIVSVDPIYAYFDIDEHTVLRAQQLIREGKARAASDGDVIVRLALANEEGFPREGTVNFVDNQFNPKTGTLRVRAVFPNKDQSLTPGMFARVRIPVGDPHEALLVSDRAIDTDQGQKIVYVVDKDDQVDSRPVRLGAVHDGLRAIEAGLSPGDRVIVNGQQRVRPGVTVDPKLVEMPGGVQKSEVGSQKSEVRGLTSDLRPLTSDLRSPSSDF
jgi:RND family efflux transporter MFP subunit